MATRWARFARGWMSATLATFVAAVFHAASGGGMPGLTGLVIALAFSGLACVLLAGKSLSLWRLSVSVALSQFLFHALFGLGTTSIAVTGPLAHAHHLTHIDISALVGSGSAAGSAAEHSMLAADPTMWLGHAAAAVLTVVALRHGERTFWALCAGARIHVNALRASVAPVPLDVVPTCPVTARIFVLRELHVLIGRMRHRGPPAALAVA